MLEDKEKIEDSGSGLRQENLESSVSVISDYDAHERMFVCLFCCCCCCLFGVNTDLSEHDTPSFCVSLLVIGQNNFSLIWSK